MNEELDTMNGKMLELGNPLKVAKLEFDFSNPPVNPVLLSNTMTKFLYDWGGYNVYANYIGFDWRVIVIRGMESAMFNPRIIHQSDETELLEEGSIAHFGLLVKVSRPKSVRVRYEDAFGVTQTVTLIDISARAILNSIDGLNGHLFYNRANRYHRDIALKRWRKNY